MTVKEMICALNTMPEDSIVTDECCKEIVDICFEPDELDPNKINVWTSTEEWI